MIRFLALLLLLSSPALAGDFAKWSPTDHGSGISISSDGLSVVSSAAAYQSARGTVGRSTGKAYWEAKVTATNGHEFIGVTPASMSMASYISSFAWHHDNNSDSGYYYPSGSSAPTYYDSGDVVGVAWDADAGKLWFSKNGVWISGNPATGASPSISGVTGTLYPAVSSYAVVPSVVWEANFGATPFAYPVPAGFDSGWCDGICPAPPVPDNNRLAVGLTGAMAPMAVMFCFLSLLFAGAASARAFAQGVGR